MASATSQAPERFLADIGALLISAEPDPAQVVAAVSDAVVRELACICAIDIVEHGVLRRVKIVHADPESERFDGALRHLLPEHQLPTTIQRRALDTKRPVLIPRITTEIIDAVSTAPATRDIIRAVAPTSLIAVPLIARGQALGVMTFISRRLDRLYDERDVTLAEHIAERVALAVDNARLYEAARRAIATREEVLAIVAHDLRNPLSGILMQLQELRRRTEPGQQGPIASIHEAAERMNRLIQDLLDVSRLEAGSLPLRLGVMRPAAAVRECVGSLSVHARDHGVALTAELDDDLPDLVADHRRIVQALDNLVTNALKFTAPRGTVRVRAHRGGADVVFSVHDDGCGITADALEHVFDRFWQGDHTDHRGSGLGLAIVRDIVESHGSHVEVESAVGVGTTFTFALPFTSPPH
ncbi:HAMP domain-containing histidine kinase [Myxococcota bacterium]|nr:HAMP domain-containing histidine kinase [Myxococcota bacterium]